MEIQAVCLCVVYVTCTFSTQCLTDRSAVAFYCKYSHGLWLGFKKPYYPCGCEGTFVCPHLVPDLWINAPVTVCSVTVLISHFNYCNLDYLLSDTSDKSQLIQNSAVSVLTRARKHDHIAPTLDFLHWHSGLIFRCCWWHTKPQEALHQVV